LKTPSDIVSTPVATPQELPKAPKLTPLPATPALPGPPVEAGPAPKEVLPKPAASDVNPPPMPLPETSGATGLSDFFIPGMPLQPGLAYARAEYLFWYLSGGSLPVLATTGPANVPIGIPGFPGQTVLFGGSKPIEDPRSGVRLTFGTWLDCTRTIGVEVSGFWLDRERVSFSDGSTDGSRVVASSPFVDPTTGLPSAILVSFPGVAAGSTNINYVGKSIWGAEGLVRVLMTAGPGWRVDGLVGFRYRRYDEELSIDNAISPLARVFVPGTLITSNDTIETANEFFGGVIGIDCQKDYGCWSLNVRPSVAIGRMRNSTRRDGVTVISVPGTPDLVFPGGTYNLNSNIGEIDSQDWTVIPEFDVRVSKQIWNCVRLSIGYTAMYFPLLARAGEQIDPYVNPNLIPPVVPGGPPQPSPILERSPAWLHGFTVGVEVRF
jgi:hypothetical protein